MNFMFFHSNSLSGWVEVSPCHALGQQYPLRYVLQKPCQALLWCVGFPVLVLGMKKQGLAVVNLVQACLLLVRCYLFWHQVGDAAM
ncbi:MAG: hypothetical protein Q4B46_04770 [Comamonadaceae bacterium]|nr:hypothetical protein [Comamonadaceae bacterium]